MTRHLIFLIFSSLLLFSPATAQNRVLAITHITIIDVKDSVLLADMTVLIAGNKISKTGPSATTSIPKNATKVDATGKFLIPGLWDMHVHLGNATAAALPVLVASGLTGVRDMGSPDIRKLRRWSTEINAGKRIGPRIVAAGRMLDGGPPDSIRIIVNTPTAARTAVREQAGLGVDFIKVHEHVSREVYFAILDEAKKHQLVVAGHVPANDDGYAVTGIEAADAGQKSLEHLFGVPFPGDKTMPDVIQALKRNQTWVDPTLTTYWNRLHFQELAALTDTRSKYTAPELKKWWEDQVKDFSADLKVPELLFKARRAGVKTLYRAGIPLLAGTDLGFAYVLPGDIHRELSLLVEAGLSAMDALRTATINPARFLGRAHEMGSIEVGKLADLVVLDANPLDAISNTGRINAVILNGKLYTAKQLGKILENLP